MSKLQDVMRTLVPGNRDSNPEGSLEISCILCSGSGHVFLGVS